MLGNLGADSLRGGEGNDLLNGGVGADRFVFASGIDSIRDFETGDDDIDLRGIAGLDSWSELRASDPVRRQCRVHVGGGRTAWSWEYPRGNAGFRRFHVVIRFSPLATRRPNRAAHCVTAAQCPPMP